MRLITVFKIHISVANVQTAFNERNLGSTLKTNSVSEENATFTFCTGLSPPLRNGTFGAQNENIRQLFYAPNQWGKWPQKPEKVFCFSPY